MCNTKKELKPHEIRVVEEKEQLGERLEKLREFLNNGKPEFIDDENWRLLESQIEPMSKYYAILLMRIDLF